MIKCTESRSYDLTSAFPNQTHKAKRWSPQRPLGSDWASSYFSGIPHTDLPKCLVRAQYLSISSTPFTDPHEFGKGHDLIHIHIHIHDIILFIRVCEIAFDSPIITIFINIRRSTRHVIVSEITEPTSRGLSWWHDILLTITWLRVLDDLECERRNELWLWPIFLEKWKLSWGLNARGLYFSNKYCWPPQKR